MREVKGKNERYFTIRKKKTLLLPTERGQLLSKVTKTATGQRVKKKKEDCLHGEKNEKTDPSAPVSFPTPDR